MIKSKNRPLRIQDLISGKKLYVPEFNSPDAFIFIYERDLFVNLRNGKIEVFNIDGELVTNFQNQELYTLSKTGETFEQRKQRKRGGNVRQDEIERGLSSERNYIISLSQSRRYLFTVVRKDDIINESLSQDSSLEEGKSPIYTSEVSIKVIDIGKSVVIAEVEP